MKPIITPAESARQDAVATEPVDVLMDRAGLGVALGAVGLGARYGARVLVLAGPGNNGGDGYVAARYLRRRGVAVEVRSLGFPRGEHSPARRAAAAAVGAGVVVRPLGDLEPADLIIDALFGAGFHGELPPEVVPWTRHPAPVVAVDLPSGMWGEDGTVDGEAFRAVRTVTFGSLKVGHVMGEGPDRCGSIDIVDIGLPDPAVELLLCEDEDAPAPPRRRTTHKWNAGTVLVAGGSAGMAGAPLLAATAALHGGAGYVRAALPGGLGLPLADPSLTTVAIGSGDRFESTDADALLAAADRFDVLALGPGLGLDQAALVAAIASEWRKPLVLDADGLAAITPEVLAHRRHPTVVTPHGGEFRRLTGSDPGYGPATALAEATGAVVLLKGNPTVVVGEQRWVVTTGGPELATLGSGDVLTGLIAALIARGLDPETAARSAAYRHGLAGGALGLERTVTAAGLAIEIGRWAW